MKSILDVKKDNASWLMALDGVEGVGIGEKNGKPTLRIYVSNDIVVCRLPRTIDGFEVVVVVQGKISARAA